MHYREKIKLALPKAVVRSVQSLKAKVAAGPFEDIALHDYQMLPDKNDAPRLTLVIPGIEPGKTFGGSITGIDVFLEIGKRTNADMRILLDDFGPVPPGNVVASRAQNLGLDPKKIEILPRLAEIPQVEIRCGDVFLTYNWWTTLNLRALIEKQSQHYKTPKKPLLYLVQDYEPSFYQFSSTHMMARQAYDASSPYWAIINSSELFNFFSAQGHKAERSFVFEPQLNNVLREMLERAQPRKEKRLLIYGRPGIGRNCFPAIVKGIKAWAHGFPEFSNWQVVSAGISHRPIPLGNGRLMKSAGKLSMKQYGEMLSRTAVGLSLMASPHPSYPPLEMAHFGLWTVTNGYANKNLGQSHENVISIGNIAPVVVANALANACRKFETDPESGWRGKTLRPSFLDANPFPFLDQIAFQLKRDIWHSLGG